MYTYKHDAYVFRLLHSFTEHAKRKSARKSHPLVLRATFGRIITLAPSRIYYTMNMAWLDVDDGSRAQIPTPLPSNNASHRPKRHETRQTQHNKTQYNIVQHSNTQNKTSCLSRANVSFRKTCTRVVQPTERERKQCIQQGRTGSWSFRSHPQSASFSWRLCVCAFVCYVCGRTTSHIIRRFILDIQYTLRL